MVHVVVVLNKVADCPAKLEKVECKTKDMKYEHRSTHSPQVRAVAALGELGDNTGRTTGARAVPDGGGDERLLDGVGRGTLLAGDDLDTGSGWGDGDGLQDRI